MKTFDKVEKIVSELSYTTCDKCSLVIPAKELDKEIVNIEHTFGFGSNQDGTKISFDICEDCFMEMINGISYEKKSVSFWNS